MKRDTTRLDSKKYRYQKISRRKAKESDIYLEWVFKAKNIPKLKIKKLKSGES